MSAADRCAKPLDGLHVLEISRGQDLAVALTGQLLASMGATVRLLVPPRFDNSTGPPDHLRLIADHDKVHGKWGRETGRGADVVLTSLNGAPLIDAGLDPASVNARSPAATYVTLTPFGIDSPIAEWAASDFVLQAMSGVLSTTGHPGRPPVKVGVPIATHLSALYMAIGALAGFIHSRRTGRGQHLDLAEFDCIASSMTNFIANYEATGQVPVPLGNRHVFSSPWNAYPALDGHIVICLVTDQQWARASGLMGFEELADQPDFLGQSNRRERVDEIDERVSKWTRERTVRDGMALLAEQEIPCGEIRTVSAVLQDPRLRRRGLVSGDGTGVMQLGRLMPVSCAPRSAEPSPTVMDYAPDALGSFGALSGLRVVEVGMLAAGPYATRLLANLGAEVIKIEPPGGEIGRRVQPFIRGESAIFTMNCSDKHSVCLDVTTGAGRGQARRIVETADAFVENLSPGTVRSWGLGFADLAAINKHLVYASVTGFGQDSTEGQRRAYDTVVQGMSGLMDLTGWPDGEPTKAGISASDFGSGVAGAYAVLVGLASRFLSPSDMQPLHFDVAMHEVTAWATVTAWGDERGTRASRRMGNADRDAVYQDLLDCSDGTVAITVWTEDELQRLRVELGLEGGTVTDVTTQLIQWAGQRSARAVTEQLQARRVAVGPLLRVDELVTFPTLLARGMLLHVPHATAGMLPVTGSPFRFSRTPGGVRSAAPVLNSWVVPDAIGAEGMTAS